MSTGVPSWDSIDCSRQLETWSGGHAKQARCSVLREANAFEERGRGLPGQGAESSVVGVVPLLPVVPFR